eukprot:CAMPEP_0171174102 /NCGR_PEP_ID=MMETSP0790-20130122/10557_1 /TAXON_ID=2925 /ORGANISM="Alexandrium catenella, Strain OF101" /LENGTH=330 /DNA_ID=CAMNT_0011638971 /DNA_START=136 /DNA_END=1128 /DNA_ORIENTATION=-
MSSVAPEPGVDAIDCLPLNKGCPTLDLIKIDHSKRAVTLMRWTGRVGNNLNYIVNALYVAHLYNCSWVYFPDSVAAIELTLLTVPSQIRIDLNFPALHSLQPLPSLSPKAQIPLVTKGVSQALAEHYLRPLFNEATRAACAHVPADVGDAETLVVHVRSGDVLMNTNHPAGRFAPCVFPNKVMAARGFKRAVLVTEPDLNHPCLELIHNVVRVQSSSVLKDACALMHAKNLAVMTLSTFADMLVMFNPHLEEFHTPETLDFKEEGRCASADPGAPSRKWAASAKIFYYGVDGWGPFPSAQEKLDYVVRANESSVKLLAQCPFASQTNAWL